MCTVVILRRPHTLWPLILGANRDEMIDRPWQPPARHWPDRADVIGGLDELANGSWLGLNDEGVVAAALNRHGSLGPDPAKRSRGELVLEALDHADAQDAAEALADLDGAAYRAFNMVIADNRDAYWLRHTDRSDGRIEVFPIPEGLSMLTAFDLNDAEDDLRIAVHKPRFEAAPEPDPDQDAWTAWEDLLASRDTGPVGERRAAMTFLTDTGFGTVSGSLIALPSMDRPAARPIWRFAAGAPEPGRFETVNLD